MRISLLSVCSVAAVQYFHAQCNAECKCRRRWRKRCTIPKLAAPLPPPHSPEICSSEKNFAKRDKLMQCQIYPRICKGVQKFHLLHPVTRAMSTFISASFQCSADIKKFTLQFDECLLLCSKAVGFNVNDVTVCISSNLSIIKILFQH